MDDLARAIAVSWAEVSEEIDLACQRAGRQRSEITVVAVSKTFPAEAVRAAHAAGLRDFGENRVQELEEKAPALADLTLSWHLIGHLQRNKVRGAVRHTRLLHALDRVELVHALGSELEKATTQLEALVQVNTTGEASKSGAAPESVWAVVEAARAEPRLSLAGFMTIGPLDGDERDVRRSFQMLRAIRDEARQRHPDLAWPALSMGMSGDFSWAIEEGATHVRIGSRLFGSRAKPVGPVPPTP